MINPIKHFLLKKYSQLYTIVTVTVSDKNNQVIKTYKKIGESFTANYVQYLYMYAHNKANISGYPYNSPFDSYNKFIKTNGLSIRSTTNLLWHGAVNQTTKGIVIGTGTQTITPNTYSLNTQILDGVGVGQMIYQAQLSTTGVVTVANNTSFIIQRTFANSSGATINVSEVGVYASFTGSDSVCIYLDNIASTPVNTSQSITIEIKVSLNT